MVSYFFALGTNHTLSKIDIVNTLIWEKIKLEIIEASEEVLIIASDQELDATSLMNKLGSASKIGKIFDCFGRENFPEEFLNFAPGPKFKEFFLPQYQKAPLFKAGMNGSPFGAFGTGFRTINQRSPGFQAGESSPKESKDICFGISVYNGGGGFKSLNNVWFLAPGIAREIKNKIGASYLPVNERELSSVTVDKNSLLRKGFELVLIAGSRGIYAGKTLSVQPYESYSQRDWGRPARDTRSGMIPPKLAKMMINLAGKNKEAVFLDPFCGSGTILQELILLGYKNIIGSDIEEKAIEGCKTNLAWLFKNVLKDDSYCSSVVENRSMFRDRIETFPDSPAVPDYSKNKARISLFKADAGNLSEELPLRSIDAIITEPYLGSSGARNFYPEQIKKEIVKLEKLYLAAFQEFKKILKENGRVVIIFPVFRFKNLFFSLQILEKIHAIGFKNCDFLVKEVLGAGLLELQISERGSVIFFRPGQTVSREVLVFQN